MLIIYSTFTETSIAKLFVAGIVPGILLALMFMIYIAIHALLVPGIVGKREAAPTAPNRWKAVGDVCPLLTLIVATLGSIYMGLVTPTEAAAVGCCLAIGLSVVWGDLRWTTFRGALGHTVTISGNILFIVYAAYVFSHAMSIAGIGEKVTNFVIGLHLNRTEFLVALVILFTVLGCLVESIGMIVVTVPLLYPILPQYGIDPIWFGIAVAMFIELGQISPPIGINLFVIQSIWSGKLSDVVLGTIPFHLIMLVLLLLLMIWPEIALWLPSRM